VARISTNHTLKCTNALHVQPPLIMVWKSFC